MRGVPISLLHVLGALGGVVAVGTLLLIWTVTPTLPRLRKRKRPLARRDLEGFAEAARAAGKTTAIATASLAVLCLAALPLLARNSGSTDLLTSGGGGAHPGGLTPAGGNPSGGSVEVGWVLMPAAVAVVVLAPVAFLVRRRWLNRARRGSERREAVALAETIRSSVADIEAESDPRRAILRAYERMEESFEQIEVVRARDETAREFLQRTMRQLQVSADAAASLTTCFERARYGAGELGADSRGSAIAALHRVEHELEGRR